MHPAVPPHPDFVRSARSLPIMHALGRSKRPDDDNRREAGYTRRKQTPRTTAGDEAGQVTKQPRGQRNAPARRWVRVSSAVIHTSAFYKRSDVFVCIGDDKNNGPSISGNKQAHEVLHAVSSSPRNTCHPTLRWGQDTPAPASVWTAEPTGQYTDTRAARTGGFQQRQAVSFQDHSALTL